MNLCGSHGAAGTAGRVCALLVCACVLTTLPAVAQSRSITGVVRDPQRAVVVGAQVDLVAPPAAPVTTATDGEGRYRFGGLVPGRYVVEVRARGFQMVRGEVSVATGQDSERDVVLELAGAAESVTVTASGGVARGYRVDAIGSLGPLGATTVLDTPNTISVLPSALRFAAGSSPATRRPMPAPSIARVATTNANCGIGSTTLFIAPSTYRVSLFDPSSASR